MPLSGLGEPIDRICSSPKRHARQTAAILAAALQRCGIVHLAELARGGSPCRLLRALAGLGGDGDGIALVGHKSQLRELLSALGIGNRELPLRKGSVLRLDVDALAEPRVCIPRFRVRPGAGQLEDAFLGLRRVG
jgi:phosphohistidine phosphatase SixA